MNGRGVSRSAALLLLGLGLLAGLFAMHGITATPSPAHATGPALASTHGAPHEAFQSVLRQEEPQLAAVTSPMDVAGHDSGCMAGMVCFALLAGAVLLALALAARRSVEPPPAHAVRLLSRVTPRGPPRARPPDIYQLSVMRL
ncbi:DUF6153 family protein [Spirillospora sp. CA-253888]